jgi:hypothetical protein
MEDKNNIVNKIHLNIIDIHLNWSYILNNYLKELVEIKNLLLMKLSIISLLLSGLFRFFFTYLF